MRCEKVKGRSRKGWEKDMWGRAREKVRESVGRTRRVGERERDK